MTSLFTGWEDVIDGTETVSIRFADGTTLQSVEKVLRRTLNKADQKFVGVGLEGNTVVFNIPAAHIGTKLMTRRDVIVDAADVEYEVYSSDLLAGKTRWRCICFERP